MSDPVLTAVGNSGGCTVVELNGKEYKIHAWTDKLRARYTRWAHEYVVKKLRSLRELFTPAEYEAQMSGLRRDILNGEYSFGRASLNSLTLTEDGLRALVTVLLNNDLVTDEEIEALVRERGEQILDQLIADAGGVKEEPGEEGKA